MWSNLKEQGNLFPFTFPPVLNAAFFLHRSEGPVTMVWRLLVAWGSRTSTIQLVKFGLSLCCVEVRVGSKVTGLQVNS